MDPLQLLDRERQLNRFPEKLYTKVKKKGIIYLKDAVSRVEKASGIKYPEYYVSPYLTLLKSGAEVGELGVLFARVIPSTSTGSLVILVEFSAALILLGAKGTIEAITAHEFTHYVELVRRILRMEILSDVPSSTLFESGYTDEEKTLHPKLLFKDRALISLIKRKFTPSLRDERLISKVEKEWIEKKLPTRIISPEENMVRLNSNAVLSASFEKTLISKIKEIERSR